jgi:formate hydrogenlyase subunit 3/multisubunit Na+/H+ antiporter MnhD subunit
MVPDGVLAGLPTPLLGGLWGVAALLALGGVALAMARSRTGAAVVYGVSTLIAALLFGLGAAHLLARQPVEALTLPLGVPWIGSHFRLDALSAAFVCVVNVSGAGASLFAIGYGRHETAPSRVVPFVPVFLGGMNLVVLADDAFTFLLAWELMSLSSWALVMAHHREPGNARAGYIYLLMAALGSAALLLGFGLLASAAGTYDFAAMREAAYPPLVAGLAFALALVGAGSKAGVAPLHVWLPLAHPAAPSHVSALMSGAMTKVAVYGFIRIALDLVGPPSWWWGLAVLVVGGVTAVLGVLFALIQHDLKRLLAYHTVENIGIIFIGIGLALAFEANGLPALAALALTAAVFHVLNHALFKSLLFLGSGAVLAATGERDLEHLGGLIRGMPLTALNVLIGCVAISALPPFNGFVSEWLTFQAILRSPELAEWPLKVITPGVGALLALSAALAAACFVKAFGVAFLGRPRSAAARDAAEVDPFSLAAMFAFSLLCLLAGILPGFVIDAIQPVAESLLDARMPVQHTIPWLSIVPAAEARNSYNGLLVFIFIAFSALVSAVAIHRLASRETRRTPAWDCGFPDPSPATQYSAGSFAEPIRRVFSGFVFQAREHVEMPPPGSIEPARFDVEVRDRAWDAFYAPIAGFVGAAADKLNLLQFLTIRRYLSLVFASLILLLLVLALWP